MDSSTRTESFSPAPGYLLVEELKDTNEFKGKIIPEDAVSKFGKVLAVGEASINEYNTPVFAECKVGDTILFHHEYTNDILEINFIKYPVIRFSAVRGIFKEVRNG